MIKALIFLSLCSVGFSLKCYDCSPAHTNACKTPVVDNIKATECQTDEKCFKLYFKAADEKSTSGIYRGCGKEDASTPCTFPLGDVQGNITSCRTCTEDRCNVGSPDGAASVTISIITLMLSSVMCFYFSSF